MRTHQPEPQHDEGERGAVIQSGFSSQTEADRFGIVLVRDLHVRRKDGIGRREQRAKQHGRTQRQTESGHRERGDTSDGEHHRDRRQQNRRTPAAIGSRQPQLQPAVNSEMMTAISVSRSRIEASSTASTCRRPTPHGPSSAPAVR